MKIYVNFEKEETKSSVDKFLWTKEKNNFLPHKVDGEKISSVEPVLGYMHRGYEKLAEVRTYPQITTLVNRIDWVSGFANEIPFIAATEKLMEIEGQ